MSWMPNISISTPNLPREVATQVSTRDLSRHLQVPCFRSHRFMLTSQQPRDLAMASLKRRERQVCTHPPLDPNHSPRIMSLRRKFAAKSRQESSVLPSCLKMTFWVSDCPGWSLQLLHQNCPQAAAYQQPFGDGSSLAGYA